MPSLRGSAMPHVDYEFSKPLKPVPYEAALKQLRLFAVTHRRIREDYPWSSGIPHGVHLRTSNPQRAKRPRLQVPPTEMLYAPSPISNYLIFTAVASPLQIPVEAF